MALIAYPITCGSCESELQIEHTNVLMFGELICRFCLDWTGYFEDEVQNS